MAKKSPPLPAPRRMKPPLPEPTRTGAGPFIVDTPGWWWCLSDLHLPFHDKVTLELGVAEAKKRNCVGVLLNGDILDSHELSRHDKDPSAPRYLDEVNMGKAFFAWLRGQLPKSRILYKFGNHEERLERYVFERAPAIFGVEGVNLQTFLHLHEFGVEWISDKRLISLGKLNVIHGHEYRGQGGVNPARWLYLKARSLAMAGHFHRTSEHHGKDIRGKPEAAWSIGCCCYLSPLYLPMNEWNHGFAFVHLENSGEFHMDNRRVLNGKIV